MTKVAVITGGGSGIGRAAGRKLAAAGWRVVLAGRRQAALDEAAAAHPGLIPMVADVTDEAAVQRLFDETVKRCGRVDLLFNNAGMFPPAAPVPDVALADFTAALAVNVTGMFLCARAAFRVMQAQSPQGGRIINNGSISAHTPRPGSAHYTASKHAVTGLTKSISLDGRAFGIACGQIDIGNAATSMTKAMTAGVPQADGRMAVEPRMDVDDVGRSILFMASMPLDTNVQFLTVMATNMPFIGRG